ncbi:triosephosphate isomerase [Candidatus Methanoperedens nitroreducens]|uniref:Triosephosphate isomerase n=1 Tax=Candidatus Methanoperedens nitratireducens TaxID=1392998 RepID=A0A062VBP6_9EURY|nr:triose-phosphate isomerase [Candidatus Methanoperedens nitroreducens]KCZ72730.1 triosephosphate isomerase [Candidatus Methanoperedens nitroreducens]MDJ1423337.1 triose-phosphate isomerase [Candidatus Methanoperedens sp.]
MGKKPLIVLNFKTYTEGMGENAVKMAKYCEEVSADSGVKIIAVPQAPDIYRVACSVKIPVFAQHIDGVVAGSHTGHITADCVRSAGATGTLINHSERRLLLADIDSAIQSARRSELITIVCTNNVAVTLAVATFAPEFVAIEPPELIGSGIPVSKADPDIVRGSVSAVKRIQPDVEVLCGAGISRGDDVAAALELGAAGVLLASGIIRAKDPKAALIDLVGNI